MENEKGSRLLLVLKMFQKTDVGHPLNTTEIIDLLKQYGVDAERKSVLRDLKALRAVGYKITRCDNHNRGYYMATHLFESYELNILSDLVSDANFLTIQASTSILQKIRSLCSASTEIVLDNRIFINENNKVETESELENIKILLYAITENKMVSFQMVTQRQFNGECFYGNGHKKGIIPYHLILNNGKYILLGYDEKSNELDCFDLTLINKLELLDKPTTSQIDLCPNRKGYDLRWYMNGRKDSHFSSFEIVTLLCDNIIQQEVKRKFGRESLQLERSLNKFMIIVDITDRRNFFDWILHMDSKAEILRPQELQIQFVEYVKQRYDYYKKQYRL